MCCVSTDCAGFDYGYVSHSCLLDSLQPIWPLRPQTPDINKTLPLRTSAVCWPWIIPCKLQRWLWCPEIRADQQQLVERLRPTSAAPTAVFAMCDPLSSPFWCWLWPSTTHCHRVHMPSFRASDWQISFQSYQVIENWVIGSVERGNKRFSSLWLKKKASHTLAVCSFWILFSLLPGTPDWLCVHVSACESPPPPPPIGAAALPPL